MKCAACSAQVPDDAAFCPRCGAQLAAATPRRSRGRTDLDRSADDAPPAAAQAFSRRRTAADDPEEDLWRGTYSPKAMIGTWAGLAALSATTVGVGLALTRDGRIWGGIFLAILAAWLLAALTLLYRRLSIHYRLTSQRLFQERGILMRTIDRVEVIDMHDITFQQGIIERLLGVGTIQIRSSDRTDPTLWMRGIENVRDVAAKIDAARRREQVRRSVRIDQI